ncbi:hypothetical protein ACGFWI_05710 [Streptomyces sp. NPDC048434]|uniref:hypothetical protein n=1 Tax=Streptomyces sp. NPDC048434 TaxID=3365549 RepID=UPI003720FF06
MFVVLVMSVLALIGTGGSASATPRPASAGGNDKDCANLPNATGPAMHFSNASEQSVHVLIAPNVDWTIADLVTDVSLMAVGIGEIKGVVNAGKLPAQIATVKDIYEFLSISGKLLSGTVSAGGRSAEALTEANQLVTNFKKMSVEVPAGGCRRVSDTSVLDYLNASGLAGLAGASTKSLIAMTDDGKHVAKFNAGPDTSWIAQKDAVVQAKYGTLIQPDDKGYRQDW